MSKQKTIVKVTVVTKIPCLRKLNAEKLKQIDCDVDLTWEEFFESVCKVPVDPTKYKVVKNGLKEKKCSAVTQLIRDLISEFSKVRKFYRVDVVKRSGKERFLNVTPSIVLPTRRSANTNTFENSNPINVSPVAEVNNHTRGPGRPRIAVSLAGPPSPITTIRMDHGGVTASVVNNATSPRMYDFPEDEDDNASQCTTATEDSQQLLMDHGITPGEIKPTVAEKLIKNISNSQMLLIQKELRQLSNNKTQWMKYASRAPQTCILLTELFL